MMDKGTDIPARWLRVAAIDVDAMEVSCLWAAIDRTTGIMRLYDEIVTARTAMSAQADVLRIRPPKTTTKASRMLRIATAITQRGVLRPAAPISDASSTG